MMRYFLFWILFTVLHEYVIGQYKCGSEIIHEQRLKNDPAYARFISSFNNAFRNNFNSIQKADSASIIFPDTIPVVVHIVHNGDTIGSRTNPSDQKIIDLIDFTNQVFEGKYPGTSIAEDMGIRFALAQRDEQCNPTSGIDRIDGSLLPQYLEHGININGGPGASSTSLMNFIRWDPYRYYNIWIVLSINGGDISGFAFYPSNSKSDGTVITNFVAEAQNTVLAHELGHAFFLYHIFQGSEGTVCPLNNDCSLDGDLVCDTDPVTLASFPRDGINPCTSLPYTVNTERNIMGYGIQEIFTTDQKIRMQAAAELPARDTLRKSLGRYKPDEILSCDFTLHLDGELKQNDVFLKWKYGPVLSKSRIWIERSYDGFHFKDLDYVQPVETIQEYSFHDPEISQKNNYYRLMQVLSNGTTRFSNVVLIKNPFKFSNSFIVLGNPIHNNQIEIQFGNFEKPLNYFSESFSYNAEIYLMDISGRIYLHSYASIASFERYRIGLTNLPTGIFLLKLIVNNHVYVKKIAKY